MAQTYWVRFLGTLANGLRVGDDDTIDSKLSKLSKWTKFWVWFWAFLILLFISFPLLGLGDKFSSEGLALTRFIARAQAPLTRHFVYAASVARDQITVVLYDRQFLQDNGSAWPITYQEHADALLRLEADPAARPKAIFLDITFGQQRNDPTITLLKQALCTLQNDYKVPVFLAALPADNGKLAVRDGLMENPPMGPPASCLWV